ncbi:MAG: hypothetical protein GY822_12065, partial [Deltaproteobacteria bacterium]|nr:hypothetical protein [Deltaproteobacteria bacterium]
MNSKRTQRLRFSKNAALWQVLLLGVVLMTTSSPSMARKRRPKKGVPTTAADCPAARKGRLKSRFVEKGSVLLGGPGLGFDAVLIQKKNACFLEHMERGDFILVEYERERAAWIHVAPKKTLASSPQKKATAPTKPSIDKKPKSGPEAKHTSIAAA